MWRPAALLAALALVLLLYGGPTTQAAPVGRGGATGNPAWSTPTLVSTDNPIGAFVPAISEAPNGVITIVYSEDMGGQLADPQFVRSTNGGDSWTAPAPIFSSAGVDSKQVQIAYDSSSQAHAVWIEGSSLLHMDQSDWGTGNTDTVYTVTPPDFLLYPSVVASGANTLDVVWAQGSNLLNIYHSRSTNGGTTWTAPTPLADVVQDSKAPRIAIDQSGNLHVVWEEGLAIPFGNFAIYYSKGTVSGGISWSTPISISGTIAKAKRPVIDTEGDKVHVGFTRQELTTEQYAYYTGYNGSWSTPIDTTNGAYVAVNTADPFNLVSTISACNDTVYLYYHGAEIANGLEQIFGANLAAGWTPRDQAVNINTRAVNPSLDCVQSLHLAYENINQTTGKHTVYYVRGSAFVVYLPVINKK